MTLIVFDLSRNTTVPRPKEWQVEAGVVVSADGRHRSASKILSHPGVTIKQLEQVAAKSDTGVQLKVDAEAVEAVQVQCKYNDYLKAQAHDMKKFQLAVSSRLTLPPGLVRI